jgi:multifunctional 2-oxoglutarate metabolism enzyme
MKKSDLTQKQKEELDLFGSNTWFVESLLKQYNINPGLVPEQWRRFFMDSESPQPGIAAPPPGNDKTASTVSSSGKITPTQPPPAAVPLPLVGENEELRVIAGSAARILDNMTSSLSVPVATSQRTVPVKLLSENRIIINRHLKRSNIRISFTHLICWAVLKAVKVCPVMNYAFTLSGGKPAVIKRKEINLGLAVDL